MWEPERSRAPGSGNTEIKRNRALRGGLRPWAVLYELWVSVNATILLKA